MTKYIIRTAALILLLTAGGCATAQNYAERTVNGEDYYVYFVEPGNTLFAISRMFSVDVDDLLEANPDADGGLSVGQEVLIPIDSIDKRAARKSEVSVAGEYIIHTVQRKETLFSISRKYGVELEALMELNPEQSQTLSTGDVLKIPASKSSKVEKIYLEPAANDSFIVHQVKKGETIYSLSKRYEISQDSLSKANEGFPEGLQLGRYIVIPKYKEAFLARMEKQMAEEAKEKLDLPEGSPETFNMAFMLPFELQQNDSLERSLTLGRDLFILTEIALEYYRGAMLALDSLKALGLDADVYVYDIGEDIVKARDVTRRPEMKNMHLIFGPMHKTSLAVVSDASRERKVYLVSPNSFSNEVFEENPYLMRALASDQTLLRYLANYVAINHQKDNVLMVNSTLSKDWPERRDFKAFYNEATGTFKNEFSDSLRSITKQALRDGTIHELLRKDATNVLVVPSEDLAFVSDFFTRLSALNEGTYDIQVYGMRNWINYDNIEAAYKNRFNLRLAVPSYIDYDDEQVINFLEAYRDRYHTEPSHFYYGFQGYDLTMFFGKALLKEGLEFPLYFDELEWDGVASKYRFGKSSTGDEFENKTVYIIEYDDYEIKRVN